MLTLGSGTSADSLQNITCTNVTCMYTCRRVKRDWPRDLRNWICSSSQAGHGYLSQQASEPDTIIAGDSAIRDICRKPIITYCFPDEMVSDITQEITKSYQSHCTCRFNDNRSEIRTANAGFHWIFKNTIDKLHKESFIIGPLPTINRGIKKFRSYFEWIHGFPELAV